MEIEKKGSTNDLEQKFAFEGLFKYYQFTTTSTKRLTCNCLELSEIKTMSHSMTSSKEDFKKDCYRKKLITRRRGNLIIFVAIKLTPQQNSFTASWQLHFGLRTGVNLPGRNLQQKL